MFMLREMNKDKDMDMRPDTDTYMDMAKKGDASGFILDGVSGVKFPRSVRQCFKFSALVAHK
jgi:hypothetical protein